MPAQPGQHQKRDDMIPALNGLDRMDTNKFICWGVTFLWGVSSGVLADYRHKFVIKYSVLHIITIYGTAQ